MKDYQIKWIRANSQTDGLFSSFHSAQVGNEIVLPVAIPVEKPAGRPEHVCQLPPIQPYTQQYRHHTCNCGKEWYLAEDPRLPLSDPFSKTYSWVEKRTPIKTVEVWAVITPDGKLSSVGAYEPIGLPDGWKYVKCTGSYEVE